MKTILTALLAMLMVHSSTYAQSCTRKHHTCATVHNKICKTSPGRGHHCYSTRHAYNFKVCKYSGGYRICCEKVGKYNATHLRPVYTASATPPSVAPVTPGKVVFLPANPYRNTLVECTSENQYTGNYIKVVTDAKTVSKPNYPVLPVPTQFGVVVLPGASTASPEILTETKEEKKAALAAALAENSNDIVIARARCFEGYYQSTKGGTKICYYGTNVAELNRAPYRGCPSPASGNTDRTKELNLNVATPDVNVHLAPIEGWNNWNGWYYR
jgi:hypothetical protein